MNNIMNLIVAIVCLAVHCNLGDALAAEELVAALLVPKKLTQGGPLPITVRVENYSQQDRFILVPIIRRFGPDTVLFKVQAPGDVQIRSIQRPDIYVGGLKMMSPSKIPIKKLAPGEGAEYSFTLVYDFPDAKGRKRLFDASGRYVVQATVFELTEYPGDVKEVSYDVRRRAVETGLANVEIIPPQSQREQEALHAMWSLPDEYLMYDPFVFRSDCHTESINRIVQYFGNYSDTLLGQRAALPLGVAIAEGVINDDSGVIRKMIESLSQDKQLQLSSTAAEILKKMTKRKQ